MEEAKRKVAGAVLVLVSLINLAAAFLWLRTGDVHRPQAHVVMRGGWPAFWMTLVLFSVLLVAGLVLLVLPEPTVPARAVPSLTPEERAGLAAWSRRLLASLVGFVFLLVAWTFVPRRPAAHWAAAAVTTVYPLLLLRAVFARRCPSCGFRIVYGSAFLLPRRCLKCRVAFR